jgi:hypothetical protein
LGSFLSVFGAFDDRGASGSVGGGGGGGSILKLTFLFLRGFAAVAFPELPVTAGLAAEAMTLSAASEIVAIIEGAAVAGVKASRALISSHDFGVAFVTCLAFCTAWSAVQLAAADSLFSRAWADYFLAHCTMSRLKASMWLAGWQGEAGDGNRDRDDGGFPVVDVAVLVKVALGADAGIPFVRGADPAPADFLDTLDVEEDKEEEEEELGGTWERFHCSASSSDDLGFAVMGTAFRGFLSFASRTLAAFVALMVFLLLVMLTMAKGEAGRDKSLKSLKEFLLTILMTILMASMGTGRGRLGEKVSQKGGDH